MSSVSTDIRLDRSRHVLRTKPTHSLLRDAVAPHDPYRHVDQLVDEFLDGAIYFPEHRAKYTRLVSNLERAHDAYENRGAADDRAKSRVQLLKQFSSVHVDVSDVESGSEKDGEPSAGAETQGDAADAEAEAAARTRRTSREPPPKTLEACISLQPPAAGEQLLRDARDKHATRLMTLRQQQERWIELRRRACDLFLDAVSNDDVRAVGSLLLLMRDERFQQGESQDGGEKAAEEEDDEDDEDKDDGEGMSEKKRKEAEEAHMLLHADMIHHRTGLGALHVAADAGSLPMLEFLVDACGASLGAQQYGYTVWQHALNSVSKGLGCTQQVLDWLQHRNASAHMWKKSRIKGMVSGMLDVAQQAERELKERKRAQKKLRDRQRRRERKGKARKASHKK